MCCQKNLIIGSSSLGWALGFLIYAESTCKQYNLANALDDNAIADSSKFLLPAFEYKTTEVRKQSLWFMVYDACIQKVTQRGLSNFLLYIFLVSNAVILEYRLMNIGYGPAYL